MLRSLYPILLLYATFTTRSLATPPQFPFSLSPLPSSDPLLKFSFPSLSSLHLALQEHSKLDTDIWYTGFNDSSNQYELILVQPSPLTLTTSLLSSPLTDNIPQETLIPSISSHLAQPTQDPEYLSQISFNSRRNFSNEFLDSLDSSIHDTYHPFQGLQEILGTIEGRWGSDWVKRESLGQSYEGRRIEVIKVSDYRTPSSSSSTGMEEDEELEEFVFVGGKRNKGEKEKKDKIGIVVYGAQHAREWITSSTILYLVHSLLVGSGAHTIESEGGDKLTRELLKRVEFTFIPVVNPDGYAYTWTSTSHRLWRKNRQPPSSLSSSSSSSSSPSSDPKCYGIDLNKNWNSSFSTGSNECSDSYPGSKPFEAIETSLLSRYLLDSSSKEGNETRVRAVLDLHSFGEQLLYPYSADCENPPPTSENLFEALLSANKALKGVTGRGWKVGESCKVGIGGKGEGLDWAYEVAKIPWSFSAQLRDGGIFGFLLPPREIRPSGEEFSSALKALSKFIVEKEGGKR